LAGCFSLLYLNGTDVAINTVHPPLKEVNMITMKVIAMVKPEKIEEFLQAMRSLNREKSRACPKNFRVFRQVHEPMVFKLDQ
jgi:hypothetical protein